MSAFIKSGRLLFSVVLLLGGFFYSSVSFAGLCIVPKEAGTWVNSDPNTNGVTRVVIEMVCQDTPQVICNGGICTIINSVTPRYYVKVWGKCHPTDCYWGRVEGSRTGAWQYFFYNHGFATRDVWAQIWSGSDAWLRVVIDTHFTDSSGRADYRIDNWFKRL
jgi:hypothetical protein